MKTIHFIIAAFSIGLMASAPAAKQQTPTQIAHKNNQFAFDLYQQISAHEEGNIFFSPFSISTALAMTYAGADGENAKQMGQTMHYAENTPGFHLDYGNYLNELEKNAKGNIKLNIANRLWGERSFDFKPEFLALCNEAYQSPMEELSFVQNPEGSRQQINKWVEKKTENRIKDLIPGGAITTDTRLVLTNAIYFKGDWLIEFDEKETRKAPFYLATGNNEQRDFMHSLSDLHYHETGLYKMLRLPYKGEKQSMILVLPHETKQMAKVEKSMSPQDFNPVFRKHQEQVQLALPKFKTTLNLDLNSALKSLGMELAFKRGANFSKIAQSNNLYISSVVHKAFIEIDEKGTEAAAATAVVMTIESTATELAPPPKTFIADHPFLFYIVDDDTGAILFMGRMMNPKVD